MPTTSAAASHRAAETVETPSAPAETAETAGTGTGSSGLVVTAGDFVDVTPSDDSQRNFQSKSGNIQCFLEERDGEEIDYVECSASEASWSVQEDPDCDLDWAGTEVGLSDDVWVGECRGDTFVVGDPATLEYGEGWGAGPLACVSRRDGVTCSNSDTGHGFRVARGSYLVF